jgi:hypothetical protein
MFVSDRAIRWYVAMNVLLHRQTEIGLQETEGGIHTQVFSTSDVTDIAYDDLRADLDRQLYKCRLRLDIDRHLAVCYSYRTI